MAGWLSSNGHRVRVYNRTTEVAERWISQYSGALAETPQQAAAGADIIFICVGNDNDVSEVVLGDRGVMAGIKTGALLVDHTTTSAELAKQLGAACEAADCRFIDAPVSGGQQGAENGQLTVMCGGDAQSFAEVDPLLSCYAKAAQLMGPIGSGQLCKMVNQICIAGLVQGLAEGLHFAQRAGLDAHQVVEVISRGAAQSWQMENRYKTMLAGEYEHGFAVEWMRKDLAYALAEAGNNGAELPVTELVDQYYAEVKALGGNRWDTSSLLARLEAHNKAKTDN
jgi:3-hydroxyisobutyrate dehydrogenase-like beta-hydroxyacid dehydrogenase